jgi:hypothetical protein
MKMEYKTFPLEVKEVQETGEFSGYLSVFNNVDSYQEIVMPGAFTKTLAEWTAKGRLPPVLWQHRSYEPVGPFTLMQQDEKGLYVEGVLLVADVQRAREAHALMKHKVIDGMSIGFETIADEMDKLSRSRKLTELKLWEGSIVTFPANTLSTVDSVKNAIVAGEMPTLKEFERFLREAGFSKTQATAIAGKGLAHLLRSESDATASDELAAILAAIKSAPRLGE